MKPAFHSVLAAREKGRLGGLDFIQGLCRDFFELHGDRRFADDPALVGGIALLDGIPVTVIATEKGGTTKERIRRNFGAPNPEGYRKALRLMKQAEKFHRPVLCFVDTAGAFCGIGAEERGQGQAIAENILEMMSLRTPVLSIILGEGGSGGALALAAGDQVWMLENAIYSVISPEACANILWKDPARAAEAAESLRLTARDAYEMGVIERILPEPQGSAPEFFATLRQEISRWLRQQAAQPPEELVAARHRRFRNLGVAGILEESR